MGGRLPPGEGQGLHHVSGLELLLSRSMNITLKQWHPEGATSFHSFKNASIFMLCNVGKVRPGAIKVKLTPFAFLHSWSTCKGLVDWDLHGALSQSKKTRYLPVLYQWLGKSFWWVWWAACWPTLLWVYSQNCSYGWEFFPKESGWPHRLRLTHQSWWLLSPWILFKSEKPAVPEKKMYNLGPWERNIHNNSAVTGCVTSECKVATGMGSLFSKLNFSRVLVSFFS